MASDYFLKYKDKKLFESKQNIQECFKRFDKDSDGVLDQNEFETFLKSVFSFNGNSYYIPKERLRKFFQYYDKNKNNKIELDEFENFWNNTLKKALFARNALVIVDVQKDFIDGSLALNKCPAREEGNEVVPVINELVTHVPFDLLVYTQDWHPENHISFYENHNIRKISETSPIKENIEMYDTVIFETDRQIKNIEQKLWPRHCVQMTDGADFDVNLKLIEDKDRLLLIRKGTYPDVDSYSAFFDNCKLTKTDLDDELKRRGITDLYICGLATDVCVAATAFDGLDLDYRVIIVEDGCKGIDIENIVTTKKQLVSRGAVIVNSKQAYKMVTGEDRRPELGYATILDN